MQLLLPLVLGAPLEFVFVSLKYLLFQEFLPEQGHERIVCVAIKWSRRHVDRCIKPTDML